jgi:N-glycosidase YbiA
MSSPLHDRRGEPRTVIQFYSTRAPYGAFSNFAVYPFRLQGLRWPTSEHYFQSQKFAGTEHEEAIRRAASPTVAARMGRSRQRPLRPDWERVKDDVMLAALRAKFAQHPALHALLLGTGDTLIVEHTSRDAYWGDGGDGTGRNMLGRLLMRVRTELRTPPQEISGALTGQ